jgi:hypothetical protein
MVSLILGVYNVNHAIVDTVRSAAGEMLYRETHTRGRAWRLRDGPP